MSKLTAWPHVGEHLDVLRIHSHDKGYLSVSFDPRCPRCARTKHPNVTRSNYRAGREQRHCTRCQIRWTNPETQPFCSCHGEPASVIEGLLHDWTGRGLLDDKPKF